MNRLGHACLAAAGCLTIAAVVVVAVPAPHAQQPAAVSDQADLARLARLAPYPAVAPAGLPASWTTVSSDLAVGGGNGPGTVTWYLGYQAPDGRLASVIETNATAAAFIRRMTNGGSVLAPVRLAGRTWRPVSTPARGQRSLYFTGADRLTVVVTGNASWAQLRELAASLRPVAR